MSLVRFSVHSALAGAALLLAGCITVNVGAGGRGPLEKSVVYGERGPQILMVDLSGVISAEPRPGALGFGGRQSMLALVREQLDRGVEDEVKALLLRIDSPGGTVTASEILYQEILDFKQETGVPVVAAVMGTAASGAYYAAMASDTIVANPTSVTGSIGVIFAGVNVAGLMDKVGVKNQTLVTGDFKDAGSPLRPMRSAEREQLQSVLEDMHARFVRVVVAGRPNLDESAVEALADGRIYSAHQAKEAGLVDDIGDLPAAVKEAESRAGLEESRVVVYHRPREWRENLYTRLPTPAPSPLAFDLKSLLGPLATPGFLYLWAPGF
ncbi:MAG: signal peptide peptidase SppA [Myxococcota bacterium]|nr:signal peptide peptidase SppA [Myxococcota bacterium]